VTDDVPSAAWEAARNRPTTTAVFLDYDGTLAPIVLDPAEARPLAGVAEVLSALATRFGCVAVVSGRPARFLADAFGGVDGVHFVGLYGMEQVTGDGTVEVASEVDPWLPVVSEVAAVAEAEAPTGVEIERKGATVTVHWRSNPGAAPWAERFAAAAAARSGLTAQPGRMALELRPPIDSDKGSVVRDLSGPFEAVWFFGDDYGDLPAFGALDDLASRGKMVVRVAAADDESPPEVAAAADVVVPGPVGVLELLRRLAAVPA
jgi:trehalose 6-phosphate phosphatase